MIRALIGAAFLALAMVPAAAGAQVGLRDDLAATEVALAGPDVLVLRKLREGSAELVAMSRTGAAARSLLSVESARPACCTGETLSASDARLAVIVAMAGRRGQIVGWRVYSGPPAGPLRLVRRTADRGLGTWVPYAVDVDGDRVLLGEIRERDERVRASVLEGGSVPIAWANRTIAPVAIAGGYAAAVGTGPRRIAVADLDTGAERASVRATLWNAEGVDLTAKGRVVAQTARGLATMSPGVPGRVLPGSKGLTWPRFTGDAIAAVDEGVPLLLGGDGSRRPLGPPTRVLTDLAADDRGIAWLANGCVRYAAIAGPAPAPPAGDPCPSTEIGLYLIADSRLRGRVVRTPVRCITAPAGVCRGTVLARRGGRLVGRGRFAIAVGRQRWVPIQLTRNAAARFRRERGGSVIIGARVPDGRVGTGRAGDSELTIKVGR
jgi:hypothetical protein